MTDSVSKTDVPEPSEAEDAPAAEGEAPAVLDEAPGVLDEATAGGEEPAAQEESEEEAAQASAVELVALREEFESLNDRHLRLAAEFNNYRRRVEQERADSWGRAQSEILGRVVEVLDDLQRVAGLELGNATVEAIMGGIDLVDRKFMRILADAGVQILDPTGERFNPETMEAMMRVPAESEDDDDRVAQVFQKGYSLKGQLIRPARVSVLKLG
ncbi:MAG: nucleotide exchange factor GrpE [Longimicrobiales bacterium]|nr:nucleotide exchange factor GrpE [Longimicrobiales bacterium]